MYGDITGPLGMEKANFVACVKLLH